MTQLEWATKLPLVRRDQALNSVEQVIRQAPFADTWESLTAHECPRWCRESKVLFVVRGGEGVVSVT